MLITVVVLLLTSCSDEGSSGAAIPEDAVDPIALSPPGTPLPGGFVVAEGTSLIARPMPFGSLLYLQGDPVDVVEAYVEQGEALGYRELVPDDLGKRVKYTGVEGRNRVARCGAVGPFGEHPNAEDPATGFACALTMSDGAGSCAGLSLLRGRGGGWSGEPRAPDHPGGPGVQPELRVRRPGGRSGRRPDRLARARGGRGAEGRGGHGETWLEGRRSIG